MKKGTTLQLIDTFVKIRANQNTDKEKDLTNLTFEYFYIFSEF